MQISRIGIVFCVMAMQYGIAIRNACVRTEPTTDPLRKYEGDVWDRRQESRLNVGEPVLVKRLDGGWLYVISDTTEGCVRQEGIFICTVHYYERYRRLLMREFQVVLKAGRYKDGQYFRVGTVLPIFEETEKEDWCRQKDSPIMIRGYLPFTKRQVHLQMKRMLGIPYSWGDERNDGMDCSSTVRGFYACFGLFLPRNTEEQRVYGETLHAMNQAEYEKLEGCSGEKKLQVISSFGAGTVIHMPGHVMLYAGEKDGVPQIFHNCDTYTENGEVHIIRKCVISEFLPKEEGTYLDYVTAVWRPKLS